MGSSFKLLKDNRPIQLFFEDEARFGRINNLSRCWINKNERAIVKKQIIREYTYAYTSVCPKTGESFSIISPYNNTTAMNVFLEEFSKHYHYYRIILCLDGAGWHTSNNLTIPDNISLLSLPPYSPELNPVEHVWDYIREQKGFNNNTFRSIDEVEDCLENALYEVYHEKDKMKSLCNFNWLI